MKISNKIKIILTLVMVLVMVTPIILGSITVIDDTGISTTNLELTGQTSHPTSPSEGTFYYNSTSGSFFGYTGVWREIPSVSGGSVSNAAPPHTMIVNSNNQSWVANQPNLQTALNLGGTITLPECNITIGDIGLTMGVEGTKLIGQGTKSQLFLNGSTRYRNMINVTGDDCFIEYISFDVNNDSQTYTRKCRAIFLDAQCQRATVQHCVFDNGSFTLIGTASTSLQGDHMIFNNHIKGREHQGVAAGICIRGDGCQVIGNRVEDTFGSGIACEGGSFTNRTIISNNFCTGYNGRMSVGIYTEAGFASSNITISNNICEYINGTAYGGTTLDGVGILADNYSIVTGNQIHRAYRYGIGANNWVTISNNRVYDTFLSTGININSYCIVVGNEIKNIIVGTTNRPDYAIKINGEGCIISNNNISAVGSVTFEYGIQSKEDNCTISGNHLSNCLVGIHVSSANFYQIDNNKLLHCGGANNPAIYVQSSIFSHITNNQILDAFWGIRLRDAFNCTVTFNTVQASQANDAIFEEDTANSNVILFNNLQMSSGTVTTIGANSITNASSAGRLDWNWY